MAFSLMKGPPGTARMTKKVTVMTTQTSQDRQEQPLENVAHGFWIHVVPALCFLFSAGAGNGLRLSPTKDAVRPGPYAWASAARDAPDCPEFGALSHDALRICSALEIIILYKRKKCNSFSQYCCGLWGETDFSCKISIKGRATYQQKASQSLRPQAQIKSKSFSPAASGRDSKSAKRDWSSRTHAAHTSGKILLALQVG